MPPLISAFSEDDHDLQSVLSQIPKMHDENVKRLQEWIALPSIAAENRNYPQGPEYMARLARDAGFANVEIVPTSGKPGVFGTLDAGARITVGIYFMYDVKQFDPAEWSSPPLEGRIVDKEGLGKVCVGRGAVNQKGPETAFLGALHAFKAAGKTLPVNLVLVSEGEEEIGSPHFPEVVRQPKVTAALKKCIGVFMPTAGQDLDGTVEISLGAKGVVELEMISSGEHWGRGPKHDVHSSLEAQVDSPSWHLVQALNSLIEADGHTPAVAGFFDKAKPLTAAQMKMIQDVAARRSEATAKKQLGVEHWVHDKNWFDSLVLLESKPTINIEGLVGGYTGPGGKTVLPHRAVAKIDMRLVPDMTAAGTLALLQKHLAKRGFGDIEVNMSGGYDPTQTSQDTKLIQAQIATDFASSARIFCRGLDLPVSCRDTSFTSEPVNLPVRTLRIWGTGLARTPRMSTILSIPPIRKLRGSTKQSAPSSSISTHWLKDTKETGLMRCVLWAGCDSTKLIQHERTPAGQDRDRYRGRERNWTRMRDRSGGNNAQERWSAGGRDR